MGKAKFLLEAMDDNWIPFQKKKGDNQIPPKNQDDEQNASLSKNGKQQVPPNKKEVDNEKIPEQPYAEVCSLEVPDTFTLFRKTNNRVANSFSLNVSLMCTINCVFDNSVGTSLLREDLVEPDWLPSMRPWFKPRLKSATN